MLRNQKPYVPYRNINNKHIHRLNSRQSNNKIKFPISYLIIVFVLTIGIIIINIPKKNNNQPKKGKVLSAVSVKPNIDLQIPDLDQKLSIVIPQKNPDAHDPYIPAKNVYLYDAENAYPLYAKNADDHVPIASTTKIMTSILALENYKLDQIVIVSNKAANIGGSLMKLHTGEKITVENLLYGLMLPSGNDAAYALASLDPASKDGDIKAFVEKMNQKAKLLGMDNTHYLCPAGLDDTAYSTAHDMAILMAYAIKNPTFRQIINSATKTVNSVDNYYIHDLVNTNRLVVPAEPLFFPYIIGGKTGNTDLAGHCLINAAQKDGHTIISVVLNTASPAKPESARLNNILLTWGFSSFTWPNK